MAQGSESLIQTTAGPSVVGYVIFFKKNFPLYNICSEIFSDIHRLPETEKDYIFVEEPSDDFFCPVTTNLMLQPYLTSCCGQHLSLETVIKLKGEDGPCPLCKMHKQQWSTTLDKYFLREVNSLQVFCYHKNRGCTWQGNLIELDFHLQDCPKIEKLAGELL